MENPKPIVPSPHVGKNSNVRFFLGVFVLPILIILAVVLLRSGG